ncbi:MAG: hypothetical protein CMH81_07415 [Nitrospiraceae bacterium]|jgi:hypothetical protein|nr:hypothetical protein [Nitrospiraceae bacterium]|tara:strand:+ start:3295 stop:3528 length:234 start_codon:yes stop_codon:yes gene_type:complete
MRVSGHDISSPSTNHYTEATPDECYLCLDFRFYTRLAYRMHGLSREDTEKPMEVSLVVDKSANLAREVSTQEGDCTW